MININFAIKNPWTKDRDMHDYVMIDRPLNKNWNLCLQISRCGTYNILLFKLDTAWRGRDHAGPSITLEAFGYMLDFNIYNKKHWDYEEGTWEKYDE